MCRNDKVFTFPEKMIVAIIIGVWYYRQAKDHDLNGAIWALIGVLSFILGQVVIGFIAGFLIAAMGYGNVIESPGLGILIGIIGGLTGVAISHYFLRRSKKEGPKNNPNSDIIDDGF